jgi:hypothetical protein
VSARWRRASLTRLPAPGPLCVADDGAPLTLSARQSQRLLLTEIAACRKWASQCDAESATQLRRFDACRRGAVEVLLATLRQLVRVALRWPVFVVHFPRPVCIVRC